MTWIDTISEYLKNFGIYSTTMDWRDLVEILIIAALLYYLLKWMKNTHAWSLFKGLLVIALFLVIARFFEMNTILWLANNVLTFAVTALIVVLQPELRKALEALGKRSVFQNLPLFDSSREEEKTNGKTISEIVRACMEMGKVRTGALIVIQREESLESVEETGIGIDAVVTSQLLINIFEKNTPLHDGAVVIRGNRVSAATCYLPLSDNLSISKDLGTRHRAGVGISDESDSVTIIVSEETGRISMAVGGELERNLNADELRRRLYEELKVENDNDGKKKKGRRLRLR